MHSNTNSDDFSYVVKGRELLERGDIASAVECYSKAFDPEALDEPEARNMLIEARANLSRKFLPESLDSFEEALVIGDTIQRRQAIEGITAIAEIWGNLSFLTQQLKEGLKSVVGRKNRSIPGLARVSDDENLVLISNEALAKLPDRLLRGVKITRVPARLTGATLPIDAEKCIPYSTRDDIAYILEVAQAIVNYKEPLRQMPNHFETSPSMTGLDQII
jgi:tetratricopeptide (TPR) repeat protein